MLEVKFEPWTEDKQNNRRVFAGEETWLKPTKWNEEAKKYQFFWDNLDEVARRGWAAPQRLCVKVSVDVFEDWQGLIVDANGKAMEDSANYQDADDPLYVKARPLTMSDIRRRLFDLISNSPNLDWFLATWHPQNVQKMLIDAGRGFQPLPSWLTIVSDIDKHEVCLEWRCFHCDEVFTDRDLAKEHFGNYLHSETACQIDIARYREMEKELVSWQNEDTELQREIHALVAKISVVRMRAEEEGYAKGLEDAKKYPETLGLQRIEV